MTSPEHILPETSNTGVAFEDILDGYFTLRETMRQMMERNGFSGAWITLTQAPMIDIPGLPPEAPVPLHLREEQAGMIDEMNLISLRHDAGVSVFGLGNWFWLDPPANRDLPTDIRLGEPAFVRGVGWGNLPPPSGLPARPMPVHAAAALGASTAGGQPNLRWFQA